MIATAVVLSALPFEAHAQLPAARLRSVFPPGGQAGTTVEVSISGQDLDDATTLHFSRPGITAQPKLSGDTPVPNRFVLAISADAPPGAVEVRAIGRFGISNPRAFVVSDQPEIVALDANHSPDAATELPLDTIANGRTDGQQRDHFAVTLRKGQRVLIECQAAAIDSRADATLTLFDPDGREIEKSRDEFGRDPLLDFTPPRDGRYVVQVYDFLYRGGDEYSYRLRISTRPHVDFVLPPSAQPGTTERFTIYGRNLPGGEPIEGLMLAGAPLEKTVTQIAIPSEPSLVPSRPSGLFADLFTFRLPSDAGPSNPVNIGLADAPVVLETEPNDDIEQAQRVTPPCEIVGQFFSTGDQDGFTIEVDEARTFWVDVLSDQLGVPTDPSIVLQRLSTSDDGKVKVDTIREVDDSRHDADDRRFTAAGRDPQFRFRADQAGRYRIVVRDLYNTSQAGPNFVYRLAIREPAPDFRLVALPFPSDGPTGDREIRTATVLLRRGGTAGIEVRVYRRDGFNGPVRLSVEGLPEGVTAGEAWAASNESTAEIILAASGDATQWAGPIHVVGRAEIDGAEVARSARGSSVLWDVADWNREPIESRLTENLTLAVTDREAAPLAIALGESEALETSLAGKVLVPVRLERREGFEGEVTLQVVGLPGLRKGGELKLDAQTGEGQLELDFRKREGNEFAPGRYTFAVKTDAKIKYRRNVAALERAEREQKQLEEAATALADASQRADAAVEAAQQRLAEAQAALDAVGEQDDAAVVSPAETLARLSAAAETKAAAEIALNLARSRAKTAQVKAESARKQADEATERTKKAAEEAKPKDVNTTFYSTPTTLTLAATPIHVTVSAPPEAIRPGAKLEIPISVERRYGFEGDIGLRVDPPEGSPGFKADPVVLTKDATQTQLVLETADDTPVGRHALTLRLGFEFNGQEFKVDQALPIDVQVEAKE